MKTMSTSEIIKNLEKITNSRELNYISKTSFFSIWDLLKILQLQYNKLKGKLGRFEWIRSLKERIDDSISEEANYDLINEIEIQDLSNSDKVYLQRHFDFPMFNERVYTKNRQYRKLYHQKLLEFSETLNDQGIEDLGFRLLGMEFQAFQRKVDKLEITLTTITEIINAVLETKPHLRVIMKGQLREICFRCRRLQKRKAEKLKRTIQAEKREERREREGAVYIKPIPFSYYRRDFLRKSDFHCLRELFNTDRGFSKLNDFLNIKKNNEKELLFTVSGKFDCETLQEMRHFLEMLDSFWIMQGVDVRRY